MLTLFQVFFSLATGLMFIPAEEHKVKTQRNCGQRSTLVCRPHSLMMAMSELKLPMLKHS